MGDSNEQACGKSRLALRTQNGFFISAVLPNTSILLSDLKACPLNIEIGDGTGDDAAV